MQACEFRMENLDGAGKTKNTGGDPCENAMPAPAVITLYTSTTPSSSKQRTECARFAQLLLAKKVEHVEVRANF